jgi:hypothetical protein
MDLLYPLLGYKEVTGVLQESVVFIYSDYTFYPEDDISYFLRSTARHLPNYTTQFHNTDHPHLRRLRSEADRSLYLVSTVRMSGDVPPLPVHVFMACTDIT